MAFQSLYRRFRPQRFEAVLGQGHVTGALRNAVRDGRVAHAYLFSGPRGTGKTSTARILAKALNCAAVEDGEPCGRCPSCVAVAAGNSVDVHELDAASNNGVDAMRDLVARAALGTSGRWKVYIVDEVHMLTAGASNALLKTLEEPPGHVVFVLATTDPQKVLPTVRSRTQHFEFRLLPADVLTGLLRSVADDAGLHVAAEAIELVARRGNGSARDALSALDQVAAAGGIDEEPATTDEVVEALCERDAGQALVAVAQACAAGRDPRQLARDLVEHLRDAFLALMAKGLVARSDDDLARVEDQARRLGPAAAVRGIEVLGDALVAMRDAVDPRVTLEAALVRLARPDSDPSPAALLERIERLERALARAGPAEGTAVAGPEQAGPRPGDAARRAMTAPPSPPPPPTAGTAPAPPPPRAPRAAPPPPPAPPRAAPPPPRPAPPPPPPMTAPPAAAGTPPAAQAPAAPLPTRDELVLAWPDVLARMRGVRARFSAGRFLAVDGTSAVFALPNEHHRRRCEEGRDVAETALAAHFGRAVPLRLVVDPGPGPASASDGPGTSEDDPAAAEDIDLSELEDAPAAVTSGIEHLTQAFPGAELVEEGPDA